jgi:outer membrane protein assembly factor BamB
MARIRSRRSLFSGLALLLGVCGVEGLSVRSAAAAAPIVALSRVSGPPTVLVTVSGTGFAAGERVDVYFDDTDLLLRGASDSGSFTAEIQVPTSALPGVHWVMAVGRLSRLAGQARFSVRTNWPAFRMNAQHAGRNRHENVLSPTTVEDMEELWATSVGGKIYASPCVSGGQVYATTDDGYLHAFNAASGGVAWSAFLGASTLTSIPTYPATAYSRVFAASRIGASGGRIAAYTLGGAFVWARTFDGGIDGPLSVEGGRVYFGCNDGTVYGLNASDGATVWSSVDLGESIVTAPTVANGTVYVGALNARLYALDGANGAVRWSYDAPTPIYSTPAVVNGRVFFTCTDTNQASAYVHALDARKGTLLWRASVGTTLYTSPAVAGGKVCVGLRDGTLRAFDARTGQERWSSPDLKLTHVDGAPSVANGVVYVSARDAAATQGSLNAVRAADGAVLWSASTGGAVHLANPAISDGVVFIGSDDGQLHAYGIPPTKVDSSVKGSPPATRPSPRYLRPDRTLRLGAPQRGLVAPPDDEEL